MSPGRSVACGAQGRIGHGFVGATAGSGGARVSRRASAAPPCRPPGPRGRPGRPPRPARAGRRPRRPRRPPSRRRAHQHPTEVTGRLTDSTSFRPGRMPRPGAAEVERDFLLDDLVGVTRPPLVTTPTAPRVFQSMMLFEPIVPVSPSSWPSITTTEPRSSPTNGSGESSRYHWPSTSGTPRGSPASPACWSGRSARSRRCRRPGGRRSPGPATAARSAGPSARRPVARRRPSRRRRPPRATRRRPSTAPGFIRAVAPGRQGSFSPGGLAGAFVCRGWAGPRGRAAHCAPKGITSRRATADGRRDRVPRVDANPLCG